MVKSDYPQSKHAEFCCPGCASSRVANCWSNTRIQGRKMVLWCATCGFGWQHPLPTPEQIRFYYDNSPTYNFHGAGEKIIGFSRRIRRIALFRPKPGRLLDVGSGLGDFLNLALEAGWEAIGLEPQASAARKCHEQYGIKPRVCVFDQIDFEPGTFDAVTIWDVWEHVHNHLDFIDRCISILKPGGLLALSIPNASGYPARLFKGKWRYVMFTHLNYFRMPYVDDIMAQRGMTKLWADHTLKVQSLLQGIEGLLPLDLKTEQIIRMGHQTDTSAASGKPDFRRVNQKKSANSASILKGIRRLVHKVNLSPLPMTKGDMVDLFYKKND